MRLVYAAVGILRQGDHADCQAEPAKTKGEMMDETKRFCVLIVREYRQEMEVDATVFDDAVKQALEDSENCPSSWEGIGYEDHAISCRLRDEGWP